jgi:hypothetical protein
MRDVVRSEGGSGGSGGRGGAGGNGGYGGFGRAPSWHTDDQGCIVYDDSGCAAGFQGSSGLSGRDGMSGSDGPAGTVDIKIVG